MKTRMVAVRSMLAVVGATGPLAVGAAAAQAVDFGLMQAQRMGENLRLECERSPYCEDAAMPTSFTACPGAGSAPDLVAERILYMLGAAGRCALYDEAVYGVFVQNVPAGHHSAANYIQMAIGEPLLALPEAQMMEASAMAEASRLPGAPPVPGGIAPPTPDGPVAALPTADPEPAGRGDARRGGSMPGRVIVNAPEHQQCQTENGSAVTWGGVVWELDDCPEREAALERSAAAAAPPVSQAAGGRPLGACGLPYPNDNVRKVQEISAKNGMCDWYHENVGADGK